MYIFEKRGFRIGTRHKPPSRTIDHIIGGKISSFDHDNRVDIFYIKLSKNLS